MRFVLAAAIALPLAVSAQSPPQIPRWEAVSIHPCPGGAAGRGIGGPPGKPGARLPVLTPGRMILNCQTLPALVRDAFVLYEGGKNHPFYSVGDSGTTVEGGPSWIREEAYTINAKAEGTPGNAMMQGPMLQAILEDRFKLVLHRETRQRPVYALTPVRGDARLRRFREGSCVPLNPENSGPPPALPPGRRYCENMAFPEGPNLRMVAEGTTLEDFALAFLSGVFVDRPVVDRTGLTGRFDIDLVFARTLPGSVAPAPDGAGPTIYTAIQEQLGLRLEPTTGPAAFIVIDRVERPTVN